MERDSEVEITKDKIGKKFLLFFTFIFFGGWNGIQILTQPENLIIFLNEYHFSRNMNALSVLHTNNLPLFIFIAFSFAILWSVLSSYYEFEFVNRLKKNDNNLGKKITYKYKKEKFIDFIIPFTWISILVWAITLFAIGGIATSFHNPIAEILSEEKGSNSLFTPIYIVLLLAVQSGLLLLRNLLLFNLDSKGFSAAFGKSFFTMTSNEFYFVRIYIKVFMKLTVSFLVYNIIVVYSYYSLRLEYFSEFVLPFKVVLGRVGILGQVPNMFLISLFSCLLFSPIVFIFYDKIVKDIYNNLRNLEIHDSVNSREYENDDVMEDEISDDFSSDNDNKEIENKEI